MQHLKMIIGALLICTGLYGGIVDTKHNLSSEGTSVIRATVEQTYPGPEKELCVYCHIPHSADPDAKPLWNRSMNVGAYTMYESDYLKRMDYAMPADLGGAGAPGGLSRQCLSCHDGTIAIGNIHVGAGQLRGDAMPIDMTVPGGYMPTTSPAHFGTDLSNHHPVGVKYDPTLTINLFGQGSRTAELKAVPDAPIKLYDYGADKYVECSSCHDPHVSNTKFLRVTSGGTNHAQNVTNTCTSCHQKDGWSDPANAHRTRTDLYTDADVTANYGTGTTVAALGCANCHRPHDAASNPVNGESFYQLRQVEQQTCYQGAASTEATAPCHSTGGTKNIKSVLSGMTYGHGLTLDIDEKHTNLDFIWGTGIATVDLAASRTIQWSSNKHVECVDCHNQHEAKTGTHDKGTLVNGYPSLPTNLISDSGALTGATGVGFTTYPPNWSQPDNTHLQSLEAATYEYEVCFKCHSYWGLGNSVNGVSNEVFQSPSYTSRGENVATTITDQAWEFNPNNRSAHPVVMTTNAMLAGPRYAAPLAANTLLPPWNDPAKVGNQTMYCSDCHGETNTGIDPKGPHGSNIPYMLKGAKTNWPVDNTGALYMLDTVVAGTDDGNLFCQNCHVIEAALTHTFSYKGGMGNKIECVNCHVAVPHGSPVSRLIGYRSMPAPYDYQDRTLGLDGFDFQDGNTVSTAIRGQDAYSAGSCAGGMNGCHATNFGTYDTIP